MFVYNTASQIITAIAETINAARYINSDILQRTSLRNKQASAPPSMDSTNATIATGTATSVIPLTLVAIETVMTPTVATIAVMAAHITVSIGISFFMCIFYHINVLMSSGVRKKVDKAVKRSV